MSKKIQTELRIVHLASNGKKFLSKKLAEYYQKCLDNSIVNEENKMIEQLSVILESVLNKNNWGIYYKSSPLSNLPVEGGAPIYKVNDVSYESLLEAVKQEIITVEREDDIQG